MSHINNDELLTRGVSATYPSREFILSKMNRGEKLTIYLGIDPTGPTLHLGHAIQLKKLGEFQNAGHKIILLMGDFTAMIGDPTDKKATRKQLTHKEVMTNLKSYKKQAKTFINFTGPNAAQIKFNSKWLATLNFEQILSLASNMTVQQMLERDMFQKRLIESKPIYMHEFMYPLMQGYDSVAMDVDGELGGNDQTFNMLCGRDLMKSLSQKEKFVITTKLLEDNSGVKMGKTEGNMVTLSDSSIEKYGKIMSWTDSLIPSGFELCTDISMIDLEEIKKELKSEKINPKDLKMKMAYEIVKIYHGQKQAEAAQENFIKTFQKKEIPESIEIIQAKKNDLLIDLLLNNKIISSKSEFRRLVGEKAITNLTSNEKILSAIELVKNGVYRIGKKRFCQVNIL